MRVIVTGAAGFIGSNIVAALNARGIRDVIAVDDLTDGHKFLNLRDRSISDYFDRDEFYTKFAAGAFGKVEAVFHQGACSDTTELNGRYMMNTNFRCSVNLLDACQAQAVRIFYASSAAVYGASHVFHEQPEFEKPLNVYGYSKLLFDNVIRRRFSDVKAQKVGLRYFNIYGPYEAHKDRMASVAFHHFNQLRDTGKVKLFGAYDGYAAGTQSRDFVHVDDVAAVNLWFFDNPDVGGIFNLGTGRSQPFNDIAHAAINAWRSGQGLPALTLEEQVLAGLLEYIDFPDSLKGKYQSFTQADISALRAAGYNRPFKSVSAGVTEYVEWLVEAAR